MNKAERIEFVISEFRKADITIDENQADKFVRLCDFMVEYNENVNLTSITEFSEVVVKHFVDSVLPFTMVDIPQGSSFIDVGTGAGFPAIPLLIWRPDLKGTLCDSLNKRCVYLEKACELIGEIETVTDYAIPNGDARRLAVIKKISQTPTKYPRNSGNIAKKPL